MHIPVILDLILPATPQGDGGYMWESLHGPLRNEQEPKDIPKVAYGFSLGPRVADKKAIHLNLPLRLLIYCLVEGGRLFFMLALVH